ncbi:MAG: Crp/Fnr family transcriptional regulator [Vicingaceae bacterium]|nr:Crp/Fnr family transcriptional regulator [Flavobacteriales bacterium]MDF1674719.1 Crp/Fnr family transcriptional regulator [Vicingaceae bacterium]
MVINDTTNCELCEATNCFIKNHVDTIFSPKIKNVIRFKKGQYIFYENNFVTGLFFIKNGKVKIFFALENQNQIIRLAKDGDVIGHRGLGGKKYPISAIAIEDSFICFLPKKILDEQLQNNAALSYQFTMFYAKELMQSEARWHSLSRTGLREKVIDALLMIIHAFYDSIKDGDTIDLHLTRKEIGDIVLTSPEQISREFTWLKEQGMIGTLGHKKIIIKDYNRLVSIVSTKGVIL